jgi:ferredoxin-NADP reductase
VVLVAGGIGITPMMSMLRWCLSAQPERRVHLYYGVRGGSDQAFKIALSALASLHPALALHVVYSRPEATDQPQRDYHHVGHVDIDLLRRTLPHGRHEFYVCGPAPMMQSLVPALRDWGVQDSDLHHEAFGPASVKPASPASQAAAATTSAPVEVRFERSGRTLSWDGAEGNLLEFAERHGLAVESGCRSGGCGACQTRLDAGTVTYAEAPDHDIAPGHCLLCVGKPASPIVLQA